MMSRSNRPIVYAPSSENPLIGHSAPSLDEIMSGRKRKPSSTNAATRKPPNPRIIKQTSTLADYTIIGTNY